MYQLHLLLLHVEPQARAEHDFDLQPTANVSLFFLPFGGFIRPMSTSHVFGKNYFYFYRIKMVQNPAGLFFR